MCDARWQSVDSRMFELSFKNPSMTSLCADVG